MLRTSVENAPGIEKPQAALDKLGPFSKRIEAARKLESTEPAKALDEARVAVALEPKNVSALLLSASLWEKTGDIETARAVYARVLGVEPDNAEAKAAIERLANAQ
jgi:Tfp pilus assembly protein PilF